MGNINFGKKVNLKGLDELINEAGKKYSIRIGIIGEKAYKIHPGTNLTNAQLGAAHEFGATIKNPGGQPYYINSNTGMAVFVKKDSFLGQFLIKKGQVTKPHIITLPTRSFLRMPLLSSEGKRAILNGVLTNKEIGADGKYTGKTYEISEELTEFTKVAGSKKEINVEYKDALRRYIGKEIIELLPERIAGAALERVQEAFKTGGFGKWAPITKYSMKYRVNANNGEPPLNDTGRLYKSITAEVKEIN